MKGIRKAAVLAAGLGLSNALITPAHAQNSSSVAEECDALLGEAHERDYANTDLSICEDAIAADPDNHELIRGMSWAYKELGNVGRAVKLLEGAASQGDLEAMKLLGLMYLKGLGVEEDKELALKWLRRPAEGGMSDAQLIMGMMYLKAWGTSENLDEAARWLRLASEQGESAAMHLLGTMYLMGHGLTRDYAVAFRLIEKAAVAGHTGAQYNLGQIYEDGIGVPKSREKAMEWYRRAAEQGDGDAAENFRRLGGDL